MKMEVKRVNNVFAEVYSILNALGDKFFLRIPQNVIDVIEQKRNLNYDVKIDSQKPLNQQNVSKEAIAMICYLHINYWCKSNEEKRKIHNMLKENEEYELKKMYERMFK